MYEVTLLDDFEASHYLTDGSTGEESRPHGHRYSVEFTMRGGALDEHGYLVNIVTIRKELDETIAFFRGQLLNSLHVFTGKNPSIERFAACLCDRLARRLPQDSIRSYSVGLWENDRAWASFTIDIT